MNSGAMGSVFEMFYALKTYHQIKHDGQNIVIAVQKNKIK